MMRSLFSGVSGLRVHQTRMDVIGNNIANVNTVGFKASRMTFADAMSQRVSGASADNPDTGRAGRNPMQIGLGVNVGGIDNIMTQGAAMRTDRPLDVTIQGEGFFVVSDASGTFFTRAGNIDWNGHYFSIGGMRLMGWNAEQNPNTLEWNVNQGGVQPLATPPHVQQMDPNATSLVDIIGNLRTSDAILDEEATGAYAGTFTIRRQVEFYDTLGNRYRAWATFRWHPPGSHEIFGELNIPVPDPVPDTGVGSDGRIHSTNTQSIWTWSFDAPEGTPPGHIQATHVASGVPVHIEASIGATVDTAVTPNTVGGGTPRGVLAFDPYRGHLMHAGTMAGAHGTALAAPAIPAPGATPGRSRNIGIHFNTTAANVLLPPAFPGAGVGASNHAGNNSFLTFNFSSLTQNAMRTNARMDFRDGNAPGVLQDIMVGPDGIITGRFSNGAIRELAQIPLAFFRNPAGLERVGNNLWVPTANSGWFDGVGEHGDMMPGTLEMSNVDLSNEFTEMITTQRGFQANSRVITTSDEMLMELVNLRR